jgi:hypothetical protein
LALSYKLIQAAGAHTLSQGSVGKIGAWWLAVVAVKKVQGKVLNKELFHLFT